MYSSFDLQEKHLSSFLQIMWECEAIGFNVTQPFKTTIAEILGLDKPVNTLWRGPDYWLGASTDTLGFENALLRSKRPIQSFSKIIFIGSGSVVESIFSYLRTNLQFAGKVSILSRSKPRFQVDLSTQYFELNDHNFAAVIKKSVG